MISTKIIPYAFLSKPNDELFRCVYFTAYSYLPGCHHITALYQEYPCHHFWPYEIPSFRPHKLCPIAIKLQVEWWIPRHCVESLLGSFLLFSAHSTMIITNVLINQAGNYYVIINFYLIWDRSQLYPVVWMIPFLHLTLVRLGLV